MDPGEADKAPQGRDRLAAAAALHRAACAAQPALRRRVHLRPAPRAAARRKRASITVTREEWISFIPAPTPDTSALAEEPSGAGAPFPEHHRYVGIVRIRRTESRRRGDQTAPDSSCGRTSPGTTGRENPPHACVHQRGEIPRIRDHHPAQHARPEKRGRDLRQATLPRSSPVSARGSDAGPYQR
jgi:hypothetical protein